MICKLCAWSADTQGDVEWIKDYNIDTIAIPSEMQTAAIEALAECAAAGGCDCQHWTISGNTHILGTPLKSFPPRCGQCYRRVATTKAGLIWRHKLPDGTTRCPGSSELPLVKGTAPTAISSLQSSLASKREE